MLCACDPLDPTDSIVLAVPSRTTVLSKSHDTSSGKKLAMFACIVSCIDILLFVIECLVHVLLFVE